MRGAWLDSLIRRIRKTISISVQTRSDPSGGGGLPSPRGGHRRPPLCRVQLWKEDLCLIDLVDLVNLLLAHFNDRLYKDPTGFRRIFFGGTFFTWKRREKKRRESRTFSERHYEKDRF